MRDSAPLSLASPHLSSVLFLRSSYDDMQSTSNPCTRWLWLRVARSGKWVDFSDVIVCKATNLRESSSVDTRDNLTLCYAMQLITIPRHDCNLVSDSQAVDQDVLYLVNCNRYENSTVGRIGLSGWETRCTRARCRAQSQIYAISEVRPSVRDCLNKPLQILNRGNGAAVTSAKENILAGISGRIWRESSLPATLLVSSLSARDLEDPQFSH